MKRTYRNPSYLWVALLLTLASTSGAMSAIVLEIGQLEANVVQPVQLEPSIFSRTLTLSVFATSDQAGQLLSAYDVPLAVNPAASGAILGASNSVFGTDGDFDTSTALAAFDVPITVFDDVDLSKSIPLPQGTPTRLFDIDVRINANADGNVYVDFPFVAGVIDMLDLRDATNVAVSFPVSSRVASVIATVTAVPEPSVSSLLGMVGVFLIVRRRVRS